MSQQKTTTYDLCKKMRDEISYVTNRMYFLADRIDSDSLRSDFKDYIRRLNDLVDDISLIPRNCDVGTAEEQEARFNKFCFSHYNINNVDGECSPCPLNKNVKGICEFAWSQMPYESEVKNG